MNKRASRRDNMKKYKVGISELGGFVIDDVWEDEE